MTNDRLAQIQAVVNAATTQVQRVARRVAGLDARLGQLGSKAIRTAAVALPALPVGATEVAVAWSLSMPDTSYQAFPSVAGGPAVAGKVQLVVKLASRTVDGCTVTVTNTGAAQIDASSGVLWVLALNPST